MKVILTEDVKSLGKKGEIVNVSDGYARNFILKKNKGVEANGKNLNDLKLKKANDDKIAQQQYEDAQELGKKIEAGKIEVAIKMGEGGKAFGSVSSKEIAEEVKKQMNLTIDKKKVQLKEEIFNTLSVPRSTEYQVQLSDGTRVWLNSESELRYPVDFVSTERKVFLRGEAYFQVAKDTNKPFRVVVNDMMVEALGTGFNINAYQDDNCLRTTLVEGKVRVSYSDTRQECILVPGEQAVLKEGVLTSGQVNVDDIIAWKKGRFVFSDMPLETIANQLERWYDVEIRFDDTVAKYYRFTGVMKRYNELEQVLGLIEETTNVRFKVEGRQVRVFRNL